MLQDTCPSTKLAVTTTCDSPAGGEGITSQGHLDAGRKDATEKDKLLSKTPSSKSGSKSLENEKEIALSQLQELEVAIKVRKVTRVDGRKVRWIEYRARKAEEEKNKENPKRKSRKSKKSKNDENALSATKKSENNEKASGKSVKVDNDENALSINNNNNSENTNSMKGEVVSTPLVLESMKLQFLQGTENIEETVANGNGSDSLHNSPDNIQKRKSNRTRKNQSTPKENKEVNPQYRGALPKSKSKGAMDGSEEKSSSNLKNTSLNGSNEILVKIENVPNDSSNISTPGVMSPLKVKSPLSSPLVDDITGLKPYKSLTKGLREIRKTENGVDGDLLSKVENGFRSLAKSTEGALEKDVRKCLPVTPSPPLRLSPSQRAKSLENVSVVRGRPVTPKKGKAVLSKSVERVDCEIESVSNGHLEPKNSSSKDIESGVGEITKPLTEENLASHDQSLEDMDSDMNNRRGRLSKRKLSLASSEDRRSSPPAKSGKKVETVVVDVHNTMNGEPQTVIPFTKPVSKKKVYPKKKATPKGKKMVASGENNSEAVPVKKYAKKSGPLKSTGNAKVKKSPLGTKKKKSPKKKLKDSTEPEVLETISTSSASVNNQTQATRSKSTKLVKDVNMESISSVDKEQTSCTSSKTTLDDKDATEISKTSSEKGSVGKIERSLAGRVIRRAEASRSPEVSKEKVGKGSLGKSQQLPLKDKLASKGKAKKSPPTQKKNSMQRSSSFEKIIAPENKSDLEDSSGLKKVKSKSLKASGVHSPKKSSSVESGSLEDQSLTEVSPSKKSQKQVVPLTALGRSKTSPGILVSSSKGKQLGNFIDSWKDMQHAAMVMRDSEIARFETRELLGLRKNPKSKWNIRSRESLYSQREALYSSISSSAASSKKSSKKGSLTDSNKLMSKNNAEEVTVKSEPEEPKEMLELVPDMSNEVELETAVTSEATALVSVEPVVDDTSRNTTRIDSNLGIKKASNAKKDQTIRTKQDDVEVFRSEIETRRSRKHTQQIEFSEASEVLETPTNTDISNDVDTTTSISEVGVKLEDVEPRSENELENLEGATDNTRVQNGECPPGNSAKKSRTPQKEKQQLEVEPRGRNNKQKLELIDSGNTVVNAPVGKQRTSLAKSPLGIENKTLPEKEPSDVDSESSMHDRQTLESGNSNVLGSTRQSSRVLLKSSQVTENKTLQEKQLVEGEPRNLETVQSSTRQSNRILSRSPQVSESKTLQKEKQPSDVDLESSLHDKQKLESGSTEIVKGSIRQSSRILSKSPQVIDSKIFQKEKQISEVNSESSISDSQRLEANNSENDQGITRQSSRNLVRSLQITEDKTVPKEKQSSEVDSESSTNDKQGLEPSIPSTRQSSRVLSKSPQVSANKTVQHIQPSEVDSDGSLQDRPRLDASNPENCEADIQLSSRILSESPQILEGETPQNEDQTSGHSSVAVSDDLIESGTPRETDLDRSPKPSDPDTQLMDSLSPQKLDVKHGTEQSLGNLKESEGKPDTVTSCELSLQEVGVDQPRMSDGKESLMTAVSDESAKCLSESVEIQTIESAEVGVVNSTLQGNNAEIEEVSIVHGQGSSVSETDLHISSEHEKYATEEKGNDPCHNNNEEMQDNNKAVSKSEVSTNVFYTSRKSKRVADNSQAIAVETEEDSLKKSSQKESAEVADVSESDKTVEVSQSESKDNIIHNEQDLVAAAEQISDVQGPAAVKAKEKVPRILKQLFQDEGVQNMLKSMNDESASIPEGSPSETSVHKLRPKRPTEPMLGSSPELDGVVEALFSTRKRKRWSEVDSLYMDEGVLNLLTSIDPNSRRTPQDDSSSDISQASSTRSVKASKSAKSISEATTDRKRKLSGASTISNTSTKSMQPPDPKRICLDEQEPYVQDPYEYHAIEDTTDSRKNDEKFPDNQEDNSQLPKKKGKQSLVAPSRQNTEAPPRLQWKQQYMKTIYSDSGVPSDDDETLAKLQEELRKKQRGEPVAEEDTNVAKLKEEELKKKQRMEPSEEEEDINLAKLKEELRKKQTSKHLVEEDSSLVTVSKEVGSKEAEPKDNSVTVAVVKEDRKGKQGLECNMEEVNLADLRTEFRKQRTDSKEMASIADPQSIRDNLTSSTPVMEQEIYDGQSVKSIPPLKIKLASDSVTISHITKPLPPKKPTAPVIEITKAVEIPKPIQAHQHQQPHLQPQPQLHTHQFPSAFCNSSSSSSTSSNMGGSVPQFVGLREPPRPSTSATSVGNVMAQQRRLDSFIPPTSSTSSGLPSLVRTFEVNGQGRGRPRIGETLRQSQRASVRQSEANNHYRDIALRKFNNFTQIILSPSTTKMKNAFNSRVLRELCDALNNLRRDDSVRMVLLTATGPTFCQGVDLTALQHPNLETRKKNAENLVRGIKEFLKTLVQFPKPIVAGVNGNAMGLGVTMLPLFDLVIASDKAEFFLPYAKLGQIPEGGATYTFPNLFGKLKSTQLFLGHKITASMAKEMGLASESIWPATYQQELIPKVALLATQSAQSMEATKALMNHHLITKLELSLESECRLLLQHWTSPHFAHLCKRFLESHHIHLQKPVNLPL